MQWRQGCCLSLCGLLQQSPTDWAAYTTDTNISVLGVRVGGKCEIKVPADLFPGEDPLPGLQRATFLLCPHMVEREGSDFFFL